MPEPADIATTVTGLLEASGLPVSDDELEAFIRVYPMLRAGADSLYIEEVRYEEPALIFRADQ